MDAPEQVLAQDEALQRQAAAHDPVSDCPLLDGAGVTLLPSGADAMDAMFAAIEAADQCLHMEYYEFEDVHWRGRSLVDLLIEKLRQGIRVALSYDGAGSDETDDALFDRLTQAGARLLEFAPLNPLRRRFNPLRLNDRDHRIEGPPVGEVQKLFLHNWCQQGGDTLPQDGARTTLEPAGDEVMRTDGSAPREHEQLYFESLKAAIAASRSHILLSTGYFMPTHRQWQLLAAAAERGVAVDLILAGYSDIPACVRAARALYGRLLRRGVRIHELHDGILHAKVATIDGVWTAIGSSNLDRRSFVYNNEIDAIILGRRTAGAVERMLRGWMQRAERVTLEGWRERSVHERAGELLSRVWSRYM